MYYISKDGSLKSTDELYHHGILGMKWGKLNGPPYPIGSGPKKPMKEREAAARERKLSAYKEKQIRKINKKYDKSISRAEKRISKYEGTGNPRLNEVREKLAKLPSMRKKELGKVSKMTLSDVSRERKEVAKYVAKVAGLALTRENLLDTIGFLYLSAPSIRSFKTRYRLYNDYRVLGDNIQKWRI